MIRILYLIIIVLAAGCSAGTRSNKQQEPAKPVILTTNNAGRGPVIEVELTKGKSFYYPLFAVWLEDEDGKYIQTLYVAQSVATGVFRYAKQGSRKWETGSKRAPQTLPYWAHKRGIKAADGLFMPDEGSKVPDAYTGATPTTAFVLNARVDEELPQIFRVMFEINQNWDWNEYWTNDRYPDDENYKMSCQPALVYEAVIDRGSPATEYTMKPAGHSHYSGKTGELFTDLSTLTTALEIAGSITVRIK